MNKICSVIETLLIQILVQIIHERISQKGLQIRRIKVARRGVREQSVSSSGRNGGNNDI